MEKLHQLHGRLEADIVEAQGGNAKIIDLMHQIVHVSEREECQPRPIKFHVSHFDPLLFQRDTTSKTQTAQINARQQFDSVTDRLESQYKNRPSDFFDFILADAELVRARNVDECKRIAQIQVGDLHFEPKKIR